MSPLSQNPPSETPEVVPAEVSDLVEAIDQLPAELRSLVRPSLSRRSRAPNGGGRYWSSCKRPSANSAWT